MSRIAEIATLVKKDLGDPSINFDEIIFAINKGQEDICIKDDVINYPLTITLVTSQAAYSLLVPIGDPVVNKDLVKKVKSILYPSTWTYDTQFRTNKQFEDIKNCCLTLANPYFYTVRNGNLEFYAAVPLAFNGLTLTLQTILKKPTVDAVMFGTVVEPEVPADFDTALRFYAVWILTPLTDPSKLFYYQMYDNERKKFIKQSTNETAVPECNW